MCASDVMYVNDTSQHPPDEERMARVNSHKAGLVYKACIPHKTFLPRTHKVRVTTSSDTYSVQGFCSHCPIRSYSEEAWGCSSGGYKTEAALDAKQSSKQ